MGNVHETSFNDETFEIFNGGRLMVARNHVFPAKMFEHIANFNMTFVFHWEIEFIVFSIYKRYFIILDSGKIKIFQKHPNLFVDFLCVF